MLWTKRIFFFIATNLIIVFTLSAVAHLVLAYFGIDLAGGHNLTGVLIFYSIMGMGASFISLWISKWMAVQFMRVHIIKEGSKEHGDLVRMVHRLASRAGLPVPPEVGIYDSPDVNAFATGPSKRNSLVAVSTGLLDKMNDHELEGVLAHEVAHIANGDMVTMSLVQGMVNVMVYMIAHILTQMVVSTVLKGRRSWFVEYLIRTAFATLLFIPGSMLVCAFSRWREYRADKGGGELAGKDKMISALQVLSQITAEHKATQKSEYSYLMINNSRGAKSLRLKLFSTHPPIQARIKRLQRPLA